MADTVLMETIGKNIKRYREKAHLTQAELAVLAFARKTPTGSTEIANQSSDRKTKQPRLANKYYSSC